jgi:hypothetical protein
MKLVEFNPVMEALLRAKYGMNLSPTGNPDQQDGLPDRLQSSRESDLVASSRSVSEEDMTSDSDDETGMELSDGLSLQKSSAGKVSQVTGKQLFGMEGRDAGRWKIIFEAIRYDYVARGPARPLPAPFDEPEYTAIFNSRYHGIFGPSAPPMTATEMAAVFPSSFVSSDAIVQTTFSKFP